MGNVEQFHRSTIQPLLNNRFFSSTRSSKNEEAILLLAHIPEDSSLLYRRQKIPCESNIHETVGKNISLIRNIEAVGNVWFDEDRSFYRKENFMKCIPCFINPILHEENACTFYSFDENGEKSVISKDEVDEHEDNVYFDCDNKRERIRISTIGTTHSFQFLNRARKHGIISDQGIKQGFMGPVYYKKRPETELDDTQICITGTVEEYDKVWDRFSSNLSEEEFGRARQYAETVYSENSNFFCEEIEFEALIPKIRAAIRESKEEIGLEPTDIHYLGKIEHEYTGNKKKAKVVRKKTFYGFYATYN